MKVVVFCHSLIHDRSHGNAHFLRGVVTELIARGVDVLIYEPREEWNSSAVVREQSEQTLDGFKRAYPDLRSPTYDPASIDLNKALSGADAVLVHEWNDESLVSRIGEHRKNKGHYVLFFHDAHFRQADEPALSVKYDLSNYDGVLAFGKVLRDQYMRNHWAAQAWTWHESADTRLFHPIPSPKEGDVVWVGNWGGDDRTAQMREFLIDPVKRLGIRARVYGADYPPDVIRDLEKNGIEYAGWIPNYRVPEVYAKHRVTIHVPRKAYLQALPGIPTIRVFEALACGIPLISAPWDDVERLFTKADFLSACNREEMEAQLSWVLHNEAAAREIAMHGRRTVLERHTCSHRADELLQVIDNAQRDAVRKESA